MDYQGLKVLVVGGGKSGLAAAAKLLRMGAGVFLTDKQPKEKLKGLADLQLDDAHLILEQSPDIREMKPDLLVLSPGVPPGQPFIQEALHSGIPLWSEVEFALRDAKSLIAAVTGSNGKTTTTTLIGELARETGKDTVVAGNIGIALSGQVDNLQGDSILVAELSSFQLEFIDKLRVNIAVILNLTPDHLDRHGNMENYAAAKARILENQTTNDLAVLNWDDEVVRGLAQQTKARVTYFSSRELLRDGICLEGEDIVLRNSGQSSRLHHSKDMLIKGRHNIENAMAATAAALELGLSPARISRVLREFQPVKHRQEIVGNFAGILFINDSKGTNPDSSIKALESYEEPIVLIAGGKNKGLDMTEFLTVAKSKVRSLVLVGQAAGEMEEIAQRLGMKRIIRSSGFEDCVQKAIAEAVPGDIVLLSPACTSWDMFKSYEERGELFKELVRNHYSEP